MRLPLQTFSELVQNMAAAVQSAATQSLDVAVGSTLRALLEANASLGLWLQWLVVQVMQMTRAATSVGADLDSWMADFSLVRLPAVSASGTVRLSRFTVGTAALVPLGSLVRTADLRTFLVACDANIPSWDPAQLGYVLAAGIGSIDVPVIAQIAGTAGNVMAGTISLLASALPGIDTVQNSAGLITGMDAESDAAFRARLQNFMSTRSRATRSAVEYAIDGVQQGLHFTIQENLDASGTTRLGNFLVFVDDGSDYPSTALLSAVQMAVEAVRPLGSTFGVLAAQVTAVSVSMTISTRPDIDRGNIITNIVNAVGTYINSLPLGASLPTTRIAQICYGESSDVINVSRILLNGQAVDLVLTPTGALRLSTIVVD